MTPLTILGGFHCKVTELELTEILFNERGTVGTKIIQLQLATS